MNTDNACNILVKFAELLNIPFDNQRVIDELLIHPAYPSLLALSDVLNTLNVSNVAFNATSANFSDIPCPFIIQTVIDNGDFMIVNNIDDDTVSVWTEKWNKRKFSLTEFKNIATGVVLAAEYSKGSTIRANIQTQLRTLKLPLTIGGLVLSFILIIAFHTGYVGSLNLQLILLTVFKSVGLLTSLLLLTQFIDNDNPLIQKICQGGEHKNCSAILSSNAAKIFGWLSWSEIGFFYFAGTWLLLLFGSASLAVTQILVVLNVVSLPYTFFSIYYQARVAKQWCVLCCTVQALLWLEFLVLVSIKHLFVKIDFDIPWSVVLVSLTLPVILWALIKPLLLKVQQLLPLKQELQKFKYNTDRFNNALFDGTQYPELSEDWCIVLGNPDAKNVITMVSNPYCQPCAKTHKLLHELLNLKDNIKARIIFTAANTDDDIKTPISRHLMALNGLPDKSIVKQGLDDWYQQRNYESWAKIYPVQINETVYDKIQHQYDWCQEAKVITTPTILLNGYELSNSYRLTDLKYMLE